ncbi:hypothetical protein CBF90_11980 [Microbacterium sp. AISO3]|jgi:hypothetical protein|uniref:DUF952 domain-containing protein n=2 Tax=Microbacterium TaxID=33882 RepID=A0ABU1I5T7_9MICO|nr:MULTISPECIES: acyl-CoA dehydrogenase [Microbacterium]APF34218.1 hypothetical protein BO218_08505 [Microbacterium paludicola]MDR6168458.1 hypothetical protein [Microbacterium paludicola]OAZ40013.1 hypothetical protein A9Z40_04770 [Microbacterium arborescens]OWP21526.1 hypothetical protein CBF90_11980 [Microbacterium sp. AISO3]POX67945.1 DUF952 domain-containing protein [Microbacterium sp. Ru50]
MDEIVCHIAIADDWGMSRKFGEYEVATRGMPWEPGGHIRACDPADVADVVATVYADVRLPLLRIDCSVEGLARNGVEVARVDGQPRILGPIPMNPDVVVGEHPLTA